MVLPLGKRAQIREADIEALGAMVYELPSGRQVLPDRTVAKAAIVGIGLPGWVFPGSLIVTALG